MTPLAIFLCVIGFLVGWLIGHAGKMGHYHAMGWDEGYQAGLREGREGK